MADTHDTIDGLLAEFRGYAAGMPDSYHVTMSWADFRKMLTRFEKANKREVQNALDTGGLVEASRKNKQVGDCAKLREALEYMFILIDGRHLVLECETTEEISGVQCKLAEARAALAAPPRNCDKMPWREAWAKWRTERHPQTPVGYRDCYESTEAFMDWFTAPATEKEGGAK